MTDTYWWLSTKHMTVTVSVQQGVITTAPPIVRRFIGQPLSNLTKWMRRQAGYQEVRYLG